MNIVENPMRLKAAATYDAAADHFDHPDVGFWGRHGTRTVALLDLAPGGRVLDVGCGTGASALPAAERVGPGGHVIGIDVAENMLKLARAKADAQGLENLTFALDDMSTAHQADPLYDAVVSVFSVFFVPDMVAQIAALWRVLRPGGQLAVTVWDRGAFEPAVSIFADEISRVRHDISIAGRPWERLTDPGYFSRLLLDAGTSEPVIHTLADREPLCEPADWWTIALGSGFRWEIDQLTPDQRESVRSRTLQRLADEHVTAIQTGALCAIVAKPR